MVSTLSLSSHGRRGLSSQTAGFLILGN